MHPAVPTVPVSRSSDGQPLRVLCAPDKFRDAVTAAQAAGAIATGARSAGWRPIEHPIADGGEGTVEVCLSGRTGVRCEVAGVDALGRARAIGYARLDDGTALVAAADAVGLAELSPADRDPFATSSRGLAAPLLDAVHAGARRIVVFLGGTANMDGGIGLLAGLGASVLDIDRVPLTGTGADLSRVAALDLGPARTALAGVELVVASDVTSPLHGPDGAAQVFGPQKGAGPAEVELLDAGLARLATFLGSAADQPGAGAAGGLGAALLALGASWRSGAELVLEITGFVDQLARVDLCITGEGKVDRGTSAGKAVSAVLAACGAAGVACVVLGGVVTQEAEQLYGRGAAGVFAIGRGPEPLSDALRATAVNLAATSRAVCELAAGYERLRRCP